MTMRLLRLYPRAWRDRYGDEFAELLAARPPSLRDRLDIVRGALDARVHPQVGSPQPERTVAVRDRVLAMGGVTAGLLFSVWAGVIIAIQPRWGAMGSVDETVLGVSYGAGMLGALLGVAVLLGLAFRHIDDMRAKGAFGAAIAAVGYLMLMSESGTYAMVLLVGGTLLMSVGLARAVGWLPALAMLVATAFMAAALFGFVGGDGQELLWLWMLVVYGPAWMLLGINLRKGVRTTTRVPPPVTAAAPA